VEILTKVERNEILEEVICEPNEGDFLAFELKEVVSESKGELFKDDLNNEFDLKDVDLFQHC